MKAKKIFKKIISSCVWLQPVIMTISLLVLKKVFPAMLHSASGWIASIFLSLFPILIAIGNSNKPSAKQAVKGKEAASHPEIEQSLLSRKPEGIIFGKFGKEYVRKSIDSDGHVFIVGGSGTGKSSCVSILSIMANPECSKFVIDIKGELSEKSIRMDDKKAFIFNPQDRRSWGYDPLYMLNENSTGQDILECMQTVAFSLIQLKANVKDEFWILSARNLFLGFLIFFFRQGEKNLIGIIDKILSRPATEIIEEVLEESNPNSIEYRYLVQFKAMAPETLGGIVAQMNNHLTIFVNDQDIRFALRANRRKMTPNDLQNGQSIYIVIQEAKLQAYADLLQLILNQFLSSFEMRSENSEPIFFIVDELARIVSSGKIEKLLDSARTLRSRKVTLLLITQSLESLMSAYTENEVTDLVSNCSYILVLNATSVKTQRAVCSWCGKYLAQKTSWNGNGMEQKTSVSFEEKEILTPSDLMELPLKKEAILISPYGYCRVTKVPYYEDELFKNIAKQNLIYNTEAKNASERT